MVWSNWQAAVRRGAVLVLLGWAGLAWTQAPPSATSPGAEKIMVVHENGRSTRCRVMETWQLPDGRLANLLQSVETGDMITIVDEQAPTAQQSTLLKKNPRAMPKRIFPWSSREASPEGAPMPPHFRIDSGVIVKNGSTPPGDAQVEQGPTLINRIVDEKAIGKSFGVHSEGMQRIDYIPPPNAGPQVINTPAAPTKSSPQVINVPAPTNTPSLVNNAPAPTSTPQVINVPAPTPQAAKLPAPTSTPPQVVNLPVPTTTPPQVINVPTPVNTSPQVVNLPAPVNTPPQVINVPAPVNTPPQVINVPAPVNIPPQVINVPGARVPEAPIVVNGAPTSDGPYVPARAPESYLPTSNNTTTALPVAPPSPTVGGRADAPCAPAAPNPYVLPGRTNTAKPGFFQKLNPFAKPKAPEAPKELVIVNGKPVPLGNGEWAPLETPAAPLAGQKLPNTPELPSMPPAIDPAYARPIVGQGSTPIAPATPTAPGPIGSTLITPVTPTAPGTIGSSPITPAAPTAPGTIVGQAVTPTAPSAIASPSAATPTPTTTKADSPAAKPWRPGDKLVALFGGKPAATKPEDTRSDDAKKAQLIMDNLALENKLLEKKLGERNDKIYKSSPFSTAAGGTLPPAHSPTLAKPEQTPLAIPGSPTADKVVMLPDASKMASGPLPPAPGGNLPVPPRRDMFGTSDGTIVLPPGQSVLDPAVKRPEVKLAAIPDRKNDPLMTPGQFNPTDMKPKILPPEPKKGLQQTAAEVAPQRGAPNTATGSAPPPLGAFPPGSQSVMASKSGMPGPVIYVPVPVVTVPQPNHPPTPPDPNLPSPPQLNAWVNGFSPPPQPKGPNAAQAPAQAAMMSPALAQQMMYQQMMQQQMMQQQMMQQMAMNPYGYRPNPAMMNPYMPPQGMMNPMMAQAYQAPSQGPMANVGRSYQGPQAPNPFGANPQVQYGITPASYTPPLPPDMVQQASYQAPTQHGIGQQVEHLLRVLRESPYPAVRESAAHTLVSFDWRTNPQIVPMLLTSATQDPAPTVRAGCVYCLGRMQAAVEPVLTTLNQLRQDADPRVRQEADTALSRFNQSANMRSGY